MSKKFSNLDLSGSNGYFESPTNGRLSVKKMATEIKKFVHEKPLKSYRLVIGTDSQVKNSKGEGECAYVTAIIIHRAGNGARYFWHKERLSKPPSLRSKIYEETMRSLDTAQQLAPPLQEMLAKTNYALEIHIDVGNLGKTREMIKEVIGMVNGNGFTAKTKPESWGASSVADKHT